MAVAEPLTSLGLAEERTLMGAERTLMAWIRTGLSMLSFGFTIYKFLLYVRESLSANVLRAEGPRRFGMFLIGLGTASMILGLLDYYRRAKQLNQESGKTFWSSVLVAGTLSVLLGLFLFFTILLHKEVF